MKWDEKQKYHFCDLEKENEGIAKELIWKSPHSNGWQAHGGATYRSL